MRLILLLFLASTTCALAEGSVAYFGLHMNDSTTQTTAQSSLLPKGLDPADEARLRKIEGMVADRFTQEGFDLLDLAPIAEDLDRVVNPGNCYGCDVRMAQKLGADFVLVGEVQKVSNALLAIHLQLRDGTTGEIVKGGGVDIRGNTDETWTRGMRYILNNGIFREESK